MLHALQCKQQIEDQQFTSMARNQQQNALQGNTGVHQYTT
jgi:hypothetical protein